MIENYVGLAKIEQSIASPVVDIFCPRLPPPKI
jgi:hypothetical protein